MPVSVNASIGGAPDGNSYENFDALALDNTGGLTPSGITVQFSAGGQSQAVQGASSGFYAAPFLSNNNGLVFGNPANNENATTYVTTGIGSVTLLFPARVKYLGLLWGSVDAYNSLDFYNGATLIHTMTGSDVTALPNGEQGANNTFYVNINSAAAFDRVVARSTSYAFEFDNVAFNADAIGVPEPAAAGIFLLGLLLVGSSYWYKIRRLR